MDVQPVSRLTVELHARRPLSGRLEDDTGVVRDFHSTLEFIQLLEALAEHDGPADESGQSGEIVRATLALDLVEGDRTEPSGNSKQPTRG